MSFSIYAYVEEEERAVLGGAPGDFAGVASFWVQAPYLPEAPGIAPGYSYTYKIDQNLDEVPTECKCNGFANGIFYFFIPSAVVPDTGGGGGGTGVEGTDLPINVMVSAPLRSIPSAFDPRIRRTSEGDL